MLTVHTADALCPGPGRELIRGGAVAVEGAAVAAVGPYETVVAAHAGARVRRWPGLLTPGLVNRRAAELLETVYHPDPREADRLGTEPVRDPAVLDVLGLTGTDWAGSARRGLQRMLGHGTTAVAGPPFRSPAVRTAVSRSGLVTVVRPTEGPDAGEPSLDPLGGSLPEGVLAGVLAPGARADFAVFDVPVEVDPPPADAGRCPLGALAERGAATCVATVLSGRLVHRRR
ncbi:hypothetical protein [Streptomyces sp. 8N706]|uniref:hypothetical protein n=1 Tax=Streptomyces sp. 8N706 TaxID=3457416 RepID=UPI003FD58AFF